MSMLERKILEEIRFAVAEIKQGVYGVFGTDDKGIYGDIKTLCKEINDVNHRQRKLSKVVWVLYGVVIASGGAGVWSLIT